MHPCLKVDDKILYGAVCDPSSIYNLIYPLYLVVVEHRKAVVASLSMWLCIMATQLNGVIHLAKFLLPSILVQMFVGNMVIHTRIEGPFDENTLEVNGRLPKEKGLVQKLKHNLFTILQDCTNSPATTGC